MLIYAAPPDPPPGRLHPLHFLKGLRPLKLSLRVFGRAGSQNPIPSILTNAFRSKLVTRDILHDPTLRSANCQGSQLNTHFFLLPMFVVFASSAIRGTLFHPSPYPNSEI